MAGSGCSASAAAAKTIARVPAVVRDRAKLTVIIGRMTRLGCTARPPSRSQRVAPPSPTP